MVDAQEVNRGGVVIVDGDRINGAPRPLVAPPGRDAAPGAAAGHPADERAAVVVAPGGALREGLASELGAEEDQRSSSMPRLRRSFSNPATGLSTDEAMAGSSVGMLAWLSQLLVAPLAPLQICTNRTPRAIIRRPTRQRRPKSSVTGWSTP